MKLHFRIEFSSNFMTFSASIFTSICSSTFYQKTMILASVLAYFGNLLASFSLPFRHIFLHRLLDALFPDFWLHLAHLGRLLGFLIENGRQNGTRFAPGDHLFHSWCQPGLLQKRIRSRTLILDGFLMDLGWTFHGF